jgi:hypothetical protein
VAARRQAAAVDSFASSFLLAHRQGQASTYENVDSVASSFLLAGNGGDEDVDMAAASDESSAGDEDSDGSSSCSGDEDASYGEQKGKRKNYNKREKRRTLVAERKAEEKEALSLYGIYEDYYEEDSEDDYVAPSSQTKERKRKPTMQERIDAGFRACNQTEARTYIYLAYVNRFKEPATPEWADIIPILAKETGMDPRSIKAVFQKCLDGNANPALQAKGSGRPCKLRSDNPGLVAAALALNIGASPVMATAICNAVNDHEGYASICRNTLIRTLKEYTNVDVSATGRMKTGSHDEKGDWAIARKVFAQQVLDQIKLGLEVDKGTKTAKDCEFTPLHWDGILWADENHVKQVIGGNGHNSSFSSRQYRISVCPLTGKLLPIQEGGKLPLKKNRCISKYPKEARACYAVARPVIAGKRRAQMGNRGATLKRNWCRTKPGRHWSRKR